jgi:hypothetical protein
MIRYAEVDGVPVLLSPAPGPIRAGLSFRVGFADETLATHGITHLVEHLALHRHGVTDYHVNGATGETMTHFLVAGDGSEVVDYMLGLCAALGDLPLSRLDAEKEILRVEASNKSMSPLHNMPLWRHGARDFGLSSYAELGLRRITADDVAAWSRQRFTRQNAVLWLTSDEIPAGLKLDLPDGRPMPLVTASSALPATPAYYPGPQNYVAAEMLVERSVAASAYAHLLQRILHRKLRQEAGLSYAVEAGYATRDRDTARVLAFADMMPEASGTVTNGFIKVLRELADGDIAEPDLAAAVKQYQDHIRKEDRDAGRLPGLAFDHLIGRPYRSAEETGAALDAMTAADVHAVAAAAMQTALVMAPQGRRLEPLGLEPAPSQSRFAVRGTSYRSRLDPDVRVVVADDGVSTTSTFGAATVLFDECALLIRFPDGGRRLIGPDGITVSIEPGVYGIKPAVIERIDAAVGPAATVTMAERGADHIPTATMAGRVRGHRARLAHAWLRARARWDVAQFARDRRPRTRLRRIGRYLLVYLIIITCMSYAPRYPVLVVPLFGTLAYLLRDLVRRRRR